MKKPSLLILATLALCGCGQKGPLYLPEHNEVVITSPVSPEATEARPQPLPGVAPQSSQSSSSSSPPAANPPTATPAQPSPQQPR
jgi:predicted small lipoprotein YifL